MAEKLKPAYEQFHIYEKPIEGVLVYGPKTYGLVKGNLVACERFENARYGYSRPILEDATGEVSERTPMEEVYVPYAFYIREVTGLKQLLELQTKTSAEVDRADSRTGENNPTS